MQNLVIMKDRQAVTSSLQVAEGFEKRHSALILAHHFEVNRIGPK